MCKDCPIFASFIILVKIITILIIMIKSIFKPSLFSFMFSQTSCFPTQPLVRQTPRARYRVRAGCKPFREKTTWKTKQNKTTSLTSVQTFLTIIAWKQQNNKTTKPKIATKFALFANTFDKKTTCKQQNNKTITHSPSLRSVQTLSTKKTISKQNNKTITQPASSSCVQTISTKKTWKQQNKKTTNQTKSLRVWAEWKPFQQKILKQQITKQPNKKNKFELGENHFDNKTYK